ncbi:glycosyltransferase family 2 protein [Wenyingzhuangia sp. 2_MG-2023]|uniref:glycosyltransferase family 2 protein n=1 Tax=Wenyingzhuangia sp. 2_MG-2023 TaxID=3062639 RepID=UPI0026E3FC50|nr:glycosyltransferase family 2 protein [Wenyingzhuangia sp. 2_MG-2023]MDO6739318.1 glycosyltransferase family 2 protein [Wenyingzhuangia sp. 2_MG-2023]
MKISIITIVYNNKGSIEEAIKSVVNQTYKDIEYIIIDGGSTDGTNEIILKYLDKIDCYKSEPDNGLYSALNKGVKAATGDVIGILHSDDLFYSNTTIEEYVEVFKNKQVDLVYADGIYVQREDTKKIKRIYRGQKCGKLNLKLGWIPLHTTIFLKKEIFKKHGLYDESFSIAGDYDLSLKWFQDNAIKKEYLKSIVVKMRMGGKSTTAALQKKKSNEDLVIIKKNKLWGVVTLFFKIFRKIPQYLLPKVKKY